MSIKTIIENIKSKGLLQAMGLLDQLYQKAIENEEKLSASEAKCAALAAELSQAKSVVSECREYFIAGIMNRIRPTNEGYLHMRCDTLGDETPIHDTFLAEVRAQGVEMCAREIQKQTWDYQEGDGIVAAMDAMEIYATQLRQDANTAELIAAGIITKVGE